MRPKPTRNSGLKGGTRQKEREDRRKKREEGKKHGTQQDSIGFMGGT